MTVPSDTETPIWGMTTSTTVPVAISSRDLAQRGDDVRDLRQERLLEHRRERYRRVGRGDALRRRVEILEGLLGDRRRDLGAEPAGERVLVQDDHLRRLSHRGEHGLPVPRQDRAQVDDLDRHVVALAGGLLGRVDHRAPGDDRDVVALPVDARLADRDRVALVGHLALDPPVQVLVLEEEHRVRVLDRGDDQAFRVGRRRRADALEPGEVGERRLGVLRVERPAREAAARRAAAPSSAPGCRRASAASRRS